MSILLYVSHSASNASNVSLRRVLHLRTLMSIDMMGSGGSSSSRTDSGSAPPKSSNGSTNPANPDGNGDSNMLDVSTSPDKQGDSVPETTDNVAGPESTPVANASSDGGSPSSVESNADEERPSKKQKQDASSMDVSPCTSATTTPKPGDADGDFTDNIHPAVAEIIKLEDIPAVEPLESLTIREMAELESALQIGDTYSYNDDDGWKPDWGGNLLLYEKDVIVNKGYLLNQPNAKPVRLKYCDWVASNSPASGGVRGLELLFRFVYNMKGTPEMAKKILAYALQKPATTTEQRLQFILNATQRVSYDPSVLQQDGWTIKKVDTPEEGGSFHVGRKIMWQRHQAIVIAHTPDETYGDLWKAAYVEDLETFDLEPGELAAAIKKYDNKQKQLTKKKTAPPAQPLSSTRFAATANFTVDGIEHGIVLAVPTSRVAQGVLWPARVRHVAEGNLTASGNVRRNSSKNQVNVVFLAPFWNGQSSAAKASDGSDPYSLGPLFEFDTIEVSEHNIQRYPFESVSTEGVRGSFRFLGLPKAVFARYLDANRLAVSLKTYAIKHVVKESRSEDQVYASANLIESHALAGAKRRPEESVHEFMLISDWSFLSLNDLPLRWQSGPPSFRTWCSRYRSTLF